MTWRQRLLLLLVLPALLGIGVLVSAWQIRRLEYGDQVFLSFDLKEEKIVAAGVDYYPGQILTRGREAAFWSAEQLRCPAVKALCTDLGLNRPPYFQSTLIEPLPRSKGDQ